MTQQLRASVALPWDQSSVPSIYIKRLPTAYNSSSMEFDISGLVGTWTHINRGAYVYVCIYTLTHTIKINLK